MYQCNPHSAIPYNGFTIFHIISFSNPIYDIGMIQTIHSRLVVYCTYSSVTSRTYAVIYEFDTSSDNSNICEKLLRGGALVGIDLDSPSE